MFPQPLSQRNQTMLGCSHDPQLSFVCYSNMAS